MDFLVWFRRGEICLWKQQKVVQTEGTLNATSVSVQQFLLYSHLCVCALWNAFICDFALSKQGCLTWTLPWRLALFLSLPPKKLVSCFTFLSLSFSCHLPLMWSNASYVDVPGTNCIARVPISVPLPHLQVFERWLTAAELQEALVPRTNQPTISLLGKNKKNKKKNATKKVSPSMITLYVMEMYRFTHSAVISIYSSVYIYKKQTLHS